MSNVARVVGFVALPAVQNRAEQARRNRPLSSVLGKLSSEDSVGTPVVQLPSGASRAVQSVRVIPHTQMAEITTVPDALDGGVSKTIRIPLNTPVVGWNK